MKTPNLPERSPVLERLSGASVPKTGVYPLNVGDKVTPVKDVKNEEKKDQGRNSEYRKLYLTRKKKKKD
jgi:hypothetical protein